MLSLLRPTNRVAFGVMLEAGAGDGQLNGVGACAAVPGDRRRAGWMDGGDCGLRERRAGAQKNYWERQELEEQSHGVSSPHLVGS